MRPVLSGLLLGLHLVVLLFFGLGLLARHVDPSTAWWLQPIALALPVGSVALVLLAGGALLERRWVVLGLNLLFLLVFFLRYAEALGSDAEPASGALRLVSFNTGDVEEDGTGTFRGVSDLARAFAPHIFALQEFPVRHAGPAAAAYGPTQRVLDSLGYRVVAPEPPAGHRTPPPVVTSLPFERSTVIGLPSVYGSEPGGTVLRVQLQWEGRSFVLYNVHLQSFSRRRPWRDGNLFDVRAWIRFIRRTSGAFIQRAAEAQAIREMMAWEDLPLVLCGDFNTTPHQWVYSTLADGLSDVYRASGGVWGPTFPAAFPLVRIDFILASAPWRTAKAEVGPHLPPDHRPVMASLVLAHQESSAGLKVQ